ncbi:MAG: transporter, family, oxalate/formate antiporter [Chloroflexota bacterium]|nr:transporter, family, oxalate/formate antiporter [Chloroflexota bacterium]
MENSIPTPQIKRLPRLVYGFFVMLFLGLIYAWSVFITPLETTFGWVRSQTSLIFTISMSAFCLGGILSGFLIRRAGFRRTMLLSGLFILAGFIGSTRISTLLGIYLTYGVLCGMGAGLGYNATLSLFARWYPDKPGFSSGTLLMGFGFGGLLLGSSAGYLMGNIGWQGTFLLFGSISAVLLALCTFIVSENPPDLELNSANTSNGKANSEVVNLEAKDMLRQPSFWLFAAFTMFLGASGLAVIGNAVPIAQEIGMPIAVATTVAGLVSVTNGASRILFGSAFDLLGRRRTILMAVLFALLAVCLLIAALTFSHPALLIAGFILIGMAYGGLPPTSASFVNRTYGPKNFPVNFSIMNLGIIPAAIMGPALAGSLQVANGSYLSAFYILLVLVILGSIAGIAIRE